MTVGLLSGQALSPPSKTVNVFDLTSKYGKQPEGVVVTSTRERAARITICVILTLVVLTGISLLLGEAFGLQWTLCAKSNKTTSSENWFQWPWNWESYKERWNSLSLQEKRNILLRASRGEVDLYDLYKIPRDSQIVVVN